MILLENHRHDNKPVGQLFRSYLKLSSWIFQFINELFLYCRDRNRNDYTLGQRSPSYSALELPQHNQNDVSIVDPLEKKPYTQLMLPLGAKPKEHSKYGVCRYKVKGAATLSGSTRPPKASQSPVRNTQQSKTNADDDYTVIENTQQGIELYNLPSYDLVVAETT